MAPEVILGKGYSFKSDYWSLGILLYELVTGILPFGEELEEPFEIYQTIL
jgi:cGMP-dependent protein kinase